MKEKASYLVVKNMFKKSLTFRPVLKISLKLFVWKPEKDLPFFKTTLNNSGSFYEGTKVGKPDEFDYFVQMDNLSQDIRFEELKHSMVAVIPSESAFEKLPKGIVASILLTGK